MAGGGATGDAAVGDTGGRAPALAGAALRLRELSQKEKATMSRKGIIESIHNLDERCSGSTAETELCCTSGTLLELLGLLCPP